LQNVAFVGKSKPELLAATWRWTGAVMPALSAFLRDDPLFFDFLDDALTQEELAWLRRRALPHVAAEQVLDSLFDHANLTEFQRMQLETLLSQADGCFAACERILRQPMPIAYNRHTHRFLIIFITFLPFPFWPLYEWGTLPVMAL
jgi:ion channel-forming bestrophin family protein